MKKKKIFRRVIAAFLAVLSLLSVGIQAAAAFIAAGVIEGIIAVCVTIAAACGLMSQTEAENMSVSSPNKLAEMSLEYIVEHGAENVAETLGAAGKMAYTVAQLQDTVDNYFGKINSKSDTSGKPVLGGAAITGAVSDFIQSAQSHVKQVADGSVDMGGYGAVLYMPNVNGKEYEMIYMSYGEFYYVGEQLYYRTHDAAKRTVKSFGGSPLTSDYNQDVFNTYNTAYTYYGDWRYADGTKADDYATAVGTKPASIGEVTDADGNTYPVNADGTVTVNGVDIPINDDGTVTINDDTYNVTYNLSNYDDTAVIDLLQRILAKINQAQFIDETPAIDTGEIAVPVAADGFENMTLSAAISQVFPFCIPFDFVRGLKIFKANAVTPVFEFDVTVPPFLNVPEQHWYYKVDLSDWEPLAKITRWCSVIAFGFVLVHLSKSLVMGAGG